MESLTYKTPAGLVTGSLQTWLSVVIETMPSELRVKIFEQVKQREADKLILLNSDGSTTTVLRAQKGVLSVIGG
jgi:hypothetical protein